MEAAEKLAQSMKRKNRAAAFAMDEYVAAHLELDNYRISLAAKRNRRNNQ